MKRFYQLLIVIALSIFTSSESISIERIKITQKDENQITELAINLQGLVEKITHPESSRLPIDKYINSPEYKNLVKYGAKLLPYLIKEYQIEEESRVRVGSKLAERDLSDPEDLIRYQTERAEKIISNHKIFSNWHIINLLLADIAMNEKIWDKALSLRELLFNWHTLNLLLADIRMNQKILDQAFSLHEPQYFSWIEWWEKNKDKYVFKTRNPIIIDTTYKLYSHPHISTEKQDNFLYLEACQVPYNIIIERAAAEMGQKVFIGEHSYMDVIANVRMRGVTFEEFADLIGTTVSVSKFPYYWDGDVCHFGGEKEAKPRTIFEDWGIVFGNTVFLEGEKMPITVVARGMDKIIDPSDSLFPIFGKFVIMTNDGQSKGGDHCYAITTKKPQMLELKMLDTEITLNLSDFEKLPVGEYNIRFKYGERNTPILPIEIYPKSK